MQLKLKPISEQTIVITGATSGIGLCTARMAANRGANVVVVARNEEALEELVREISDLGGNATYAIADVADERSARTRCGNCAVAIRKYRYVGEQCRDIDLRAYHGCSN